MPETTVARREPPGEPTAAERFEAAEAAGEPRTGWFHFCVVPDFCTRSCADCGVGARHAREALG